MIGFAELLYKVGVSKLASSSEVIVKSNGSVISFSTTKSLLANWLNPLKYSFGSPNSGGEVY